MTHSPEELNRLLGAAKAAESEGNVARAHELYERANTLRHSSDDASLIAALAIVSDSPKPYAVHYHDLPSRRINLSALAHSYISATDAIVTAIAHLRSIALNHAEPARSGVVSSPVTTTSLDRMSSQASADATPQAETNSSEVSL